MDNGICVQQNNVPVGAAPESVVHSAQKSHVPGGGFEDDFPVTGQLVKVLEQGLIRPVVPDRNNVKFTGTGAPGCQKSGKGDLGGFFVVVYRHDHCRCTGHFA